MPRIWSKLLASFLVAALGGFGVAMPEALAKRPRRAAKSKAAEAVSAPAFTEGARSEGTSTSSGSSNGSSNASASNASGGDDRPRAAATAGGGDAAPRPAAKPRVYTFGGLDVNGNLKAPQLLFFRGRVKQELDTSSPEKRSFLKELERTADAKGL